MIKLQTKELREFKSVASNIKPNIILPILSYLKFDKGKITKNNLQAFVEMDATFEGSFLLDENILMAFIGETKSTEIEVEIKDKTATLKDGKRKTNCPTDNFINFPVNSTVGHDEIVFDNEILEQIGIASNFTVDDDNRPYTSCVFIGNGIVGASDGFIAYTKLIDDSYPKIILEKGAVNAIRNFDNVNFSTNDTYQFFKKGQFTFGFGKKDTNFLPLKPFSFVPNDLERFEIDKREIISNCQTCVDLCKGKPVYATIEGDQITMINSDYGTDYKNELSVSMPEFTFNPALLSKLLKSLPDEKVYISKENQRYYITGDGGYVALIMAMMK